MAIYSKALFWAAAIILVALGSKIHVIPKDLADTLVLILPIVAWISIARGFCGSCTLTEG